MSFVWAVLAAVLLLGVVGGVPAWSLGLRGLWQVAAATPFALTIIGGTAVIAPLLGVAWSALPVLIVTLLVSAAIYAARRLLARRSAAGVATAATSVRADIWMLAGLLVAAIALGSQVMMAIGAPDRISQTFDNVFHLNGVRYILDTANASSLHLGYMTSPDGTLPFYPAGWHDVVSLVVQMGGISIPVAVNAVVLVTAAVVWPASALVLTRTLFGSSLPIAVGTVAAAVSVPAFPLLLMDYGVLYPFQLGLAMLPVAIAATVRVLHLVAGEAPVGTGWWVLALVGIIPGLAITHPGAVVAWLALTVPMFLAFAWRRFRRGGAVVRVLVIVGLVAYGTAGRLLVRTLRPPLEARMWPLQLRTLDAVFQGLTLSMWYAVPAVVAAMAVLAGIVWVLVDRTLVGTLAVAMWGIGVILFVAVSSLQWQQLRDALTGSWYNNLPRLAAILVIALVPLAAFGIARTWHAIAARAMQRRAEALPPWRAAIGAAIGVAVVCLAMVGAVPRGIEWASYAYRLDPSSPLLSADEYALLRRVPDHVPPGTTIAGSAWTGASLAYAISNRPVLMPHTLMQITQDIETIDAGLDTAQPGSPVCAALADRHVGFVLDFPGPEVHGGSHDFAGLDGLAQSSSVRLVDSQGPAALYQIVACG